MHRYDLERGTGKLQIFTRVVPHLFGEAGTSNIEASLEAAVERSRVNIMGAESTDSLDMVQLSWLDFKVRCGSYSPFLSFVVSVFESGELIRSCCICSPNAAVMIADGHEQQACMAFGLDSDLSPV